jgi:Ca-activated chloride channel homolog
MKNLLKSLAAGLLLAGIFFFFSCETDDVGPSNYAFFDSNGTGYSAGTGSGIGGDTTGEGYNDYVENPFVQTAEEPVSTFAIDADGASYSNVRRFLRNGQLPPKGAIRTEELINYFQFDYPEPVGGHPISLNGEVANCPWTPSHKLLRIGIKGRHIAQENLPPANFVFLIDVSGSMSSNDKLGLLRDAFKMFTDYLRPEDRIAIVTYAGSAGVVLESTPGDEKTKIKNAINQLKSGGSTNGAGGILKAYEIAVENFIDGGNNRVILGTDGDFNVGISDQDALIALIEEKRESGVFLTTLGVGTGNYQDGKMEQLANNGNGTYEYIDDMPQAEKVFVHEFGKFYTVAKDVKIQLAFDPEVVEQYRLIGYENRLLNPEDFVDDTKDAGEIGADQTITALYELVMKPAAPFTVPALNIDFRYKNPDSDTSIPLSLDVQNTGVSFSNASENMRFAATVAGYGMLLWESAYTGNLTYDNLIAWANDAKTFDPNGWRNEFVQWVDKAKGL